MERRASPCPVPAVGWYGSLGTLLLLVALFAVGAFDATGGGRIALGGVAAALSGYFVLVALGRVARGRIERSPEGIYQRSWSFEVFLPWRGVVRLAPRGEDGQAIYVVGFGNAPWHRRRFVNLGRKDRPLTTPGIHIPGNVLAVDPALVYHLLGYYLDNAAARAELGTEAALRRARAAAFG
ncbi:hypothetical protein [Qaidamihabitans albus]|uniref:hypothetical protein n=1 Tax=Qaidamihabitans albus TaxID=2795733 RepID=UPI0018F1F1AA|nr:hypothetical protein [Qaidamihabitans albus]